MNELTLPEVQSFEQRPRFYPDEKTGQLMVEISHIGMKDTNIKKVTPEIMAQFRTAWDAYCDGRPMEQRKGTPLTDVPQINAEMARIYIDRNVHTLEELAVLNDMQCQNLGHGTLTWRKHARDLLMRRHTDHQTKTQNLIAAGQATSAPAPADGKVEAALLDLSAKMDALITILGQQLAQPHPVDPPKRGPGRPPKVRDDGTDDAV